MTKKSPLIIVGGGLSGSLAALLLSERRPDLPLLLMEGGSSFGGNHTWSFFDSDVPAAARALVEALQPVRWPRHKVRFPGRARDFNMAYNAVNAPALDALVRSRLPAANWRLNTGVAQTARDWVTLETGETIAASGVIDARGPDGPLPGLELGWQKFVGIEFAASAPDPDCATVMDACLPQVDGYRFVYVLPLAADRVLVEDTYYSDGPDLGTGQIATRVRALAAERGMSGAELRQESGVLPILIGGDPEIFWPADDPVARLGLRGGFFHPTTGYSFSLALKMADALAGFEGIFHGETLARFTRDLFMEHWDKSQYYHMLNRMLFRAARPDKRYRIFEHFYRLPPDLIARFYAGELTRWDKLRILSGRPPVPIGPALAALFGRGRTER